ncbi:50S ribosomal protein L31 [bacterium]|nr:50S ribosomal protein L31 [bacterium]
MKKGIHPELFEVSATCTCGALLQTSSTSKVIKTTLCSKCHPFFTGDQKFVDTAGRIEKFQAKYKKFKKGKK